MIALTKKGEIEMKTKLLPSIQNQAVIALMLIQLVHKIVREIPGAVKLGGPEWDLVVSNISMDTGITNYLFLPSCMEKLGVDTLGDTTIPHISLNRTPPSIVVPPKSSLHPMYSSRKR